MILIRWDYNHFITWAIQSGKNGVDGKAVVCGSIYRSWKELEDFFGKSNGRRKINLYVIE